MNANVPSVLHLAVPLHNVLFVVRRGVSLEQRYGVSRAESADRDVGAVSPAASG